MMKGISRAEEQRLKALWDKEIEKNKVQLEQLTERRKAAFRHLRKGLRRAYENGYNSGYAEGHSDGMGEGRREAYATTPKEMYERGKREQQNGKI